MINICNPFTCPYLKIVPLVLTLGIHVVLEIIVDAWFPCRETTLSLVIAISKVLLSH